jgi:hypothetical protein
METRKIRNMLVLLRIFSPKLVEETNVIHKYLRCVREFCLESEETVDSKLVGYKAVNPIYLYSKQFRSDGP